MGIYGWSSLRRTYSDTLLYDRKHKNQYIAVKLNKQNYSDCLKKIDKENCFTDDTADHLRNILNDIFDETSSDESDKEFEDFVNIFSTESLVIQKNLLAKDNLEVPKLAKPGSYRTIPLDIIVDFPTLSIHSNFDISGGQPDMYYRTNTISSRNASSCCYSGESYKKYSMQKREPKPFVHRSGLNYCFDNQSNSRPIRQRSVSPNLPKIPYLEKPPQHTYPQVTSQRKSRVIFKHRPFREHHQKANNNASKKSIPDHALMKTLLSGLSIFDNDDEVKVSYSKDINKHKSMGNIKSSGTQSCALKGNYKSDIDFRESTMGNSEDTLENFKDYYNSYKHSVSTKQCPENNKNRSYECNNNCSFNSHKYVATDNIFGKEKGDNTHARPGVGMPQGRATLVERRRHFFENQKKEKELENVNQKPTTLVISCVSKAIQNEKSDEITELYRNLHSVHSTSTLSKRSSSLPPVCKFRKYNTRNGELFNPDYNFCCETNTGSNGCLRNSIIQSIRSKVFQKNKNVINECEDDWNPGSSWMLKFPKETRTAMSIILSNKNSSVSCKYCREQIRKKQLTHIETQTSPQISKHEIVKPSDDISQLPCPKNLLCEKGYHFGRCDESVRRKLDVVCDEHCVCRENRRMLECGNMSYWPGQAVRLRDETNHDLENPAEDFLGLIRPDLETSEEILGDHQHLFNESPFSQPPITMNGLNGHTNGDLNGCGDIITQNQQRGCWTIGLINSKYRYLTAETFGFKINANGASLKKKQIWTLEPDTSSGSETCVYLKSHLDKYLAVDSFGNVTCESEEKEAGSKFQVTVSEDNTGRWAFRNVVRGYFLGSSSDKLTCTAKAPGDSEYWHIHLAARPQVNLRSVGRKRFAHLSENLDEIHVDANIPWGEDTLFTLEFHADEDGKYALHTCNNKYLSNGGKLVDTCNKECLFSAEYHSGQLALRDRNGQYLSPIGSKAVLKTRSNTVTKDELFSLEDSLPQASFVAALNSRYVSVKQGVDVTANQDEISDHETFQLEFDWSTKRWYIRTMQDKYWTLETGGGIQASGDKRSSNALFDLVWQGDGSLAFRANNGRYVITKRSGHLYATSDVIDDNCKYFFYLINRPILVLKCEQGFVGYKSASSPKLECNKATYECIQVERSEKGIIYFKGQSGKYWHVDSEGVTADSDAPEGFYLELREPTRLCIKTANGNYLTASKNGLFRLGDSAIENATQWEY